MIDTDEYIEMWNDNLLGSEGVNDLMNALIAEVKRLRKREETFDEFIDSLDVFNEHEWMLIQRIDEIHKRLHHEDLLEVIE